MPFVSEAQRRLFYARPELHKYIGEFNAATPKGAVLPQHVQKEKPMSAFDRLAAKLGERKGVQNPRALAAAIGRKRYGSKVMSQASARGVSAASIAKRGK